MSWQHYLYSKLGSKKDPATEGKPQQIEEVVDRIVAMAKVLFGLHMVIFFHIVFIILRNHTRIIDFDDIGLIRRCLRGSH